LKDVVVESLEECDECPVFIYNGGFFRIIAVFIGRDTPFEHLVDS
jgi:hypothetical protein